MVMNQTDPYIAEENIAVREKALIVSREFDRIVNTFRKVLEFKEKYGKNLEESFDDIKIKLKDNLDQLEEVNQNLEIYDRNSEKIISNLKQLDEDERKFSEQYERLLRGVGLDGKGLLGAENFENSNISPPNGAEPNATEPNGAEGQELRERLLRRRGEFLDNLKHSFDKLDENLASINDLKTELNESRIEISERKFQALEKKEELEEMGKKIVNDVGRLENELAITTGEEKTLIDEFSKIVSHVESCLVLDEATDHVLFSSLSICESPENSPVDNESPENPTVQ
jgi:DNA repair exonuclease SbcCD ATPase subunit